MIARDHPLLQPEKIAFSSTLQSEDDLSGFLALGGHGFVFEYKLKETLYEFDGTSYTWSQREGLMPWGGKSWMAAVVLPDDYVEC